MDPWCTTTGARDGTFAPTLPWPSRSTTQAAGGTGTRSASAPPLTTGPLSQPGARRVVAPAVRAAASGHAPPPPAAVAAQPAPDSLHALVASTCGEAPVACTNRPGTVGASAHTSVVLALRRQQQPLPTVRSANNKGAAVPLPEPTPPSLGTAAGGRSPWFGAHLVRYLLCDREGGRCM